MKKNKYSPALFALGLFGLMACQENVETFENKAYLNADGKVKTCLLKGASSTYETGIQLSMAKPAATDIRFLLRANPALVEQYNAAYYENAVLLPEECYINNYDNLTGDLASSKHLAVDVIPAGTVTSTGVKIRLNGLNELDRELVYVLPISITSDNIDMLASAQTTYIVVKGAALVNTVANINKTYLGLIDPASADNLKNMSAVTAEALIRVSKFGKLISTVMGIEGKFLIRIGDANLADNQVQLATSNGNVTDLSWTINTGEWAHIALTYDRSTREVNFYLNGVKKGATQIASFNGTVNWATSDFYIGRSYDNNRWLEGDICECRVWKRVLTADEINAKYHFYMIDPTSKDLAAYWKFDEGAGNTIKDHTNGYDIEVKKSGNDFTPLTWKPVQMP